LAVELAVNSTCHLHDSKSLSSFLFGLDREYLLVLLDSIGNHFGQVTILVVSHFIQPAVAAHNLPYILRVNAQHDHVVAVGSQLGEDQVLFPQDCLLEGLPFLWAEARHLLVGGLEDSGVPEVVFFPQ
jgi:hypothetical protein